MAFEGGSSTEIPRAFLESLQNDFKTLSAETKKKYPQIKEVIVVYVLVISLYSK